MHSHQFQLIKGDGGAIGLTKNPSQLLRWMICGPEVSRLINEFQTSEELTKKSQSEGPDLRHHEQMSGVQATFQKQVKALCTTFVEMGNPFLEESKDLLVLDTRDIVDTSVAETVRKIEELGKTQFKAFVADRLEKQTVSLFEPMKRNNLALFSSPPPSKAKSSDKM